MGKGSGLTSTVWFYRGANESREDVRTARPVLLALATFQNPSANHIVKCYNDKTSQLCLRDCGRWHPFDEATSWCGTTSPVHVLNNQRWLPWAPPSGEALGRSLLLCSSAAVLAAAAADLQLEDCKRSAMRSKPPVPSVLKQKTSNVSSTG